MDDLTSDGNHVDDETGVGDVGDRLEHLADVDAADAPAAAESLADDLTDALDRAGDTRREDATTPETDHPGDVTGV